MAKDKKKSNRVKNIAFLTLIGLYVAFLVISLVVEYEPGKGIGGNFLDFLKMMVGILPCAFVLIGLFEVWVKRETIERHLGRESGLMSHVWMILLAGTTVGGLYVAFPVAGSLYRKGARLSVIFTYVGAAGLCRIPMTLFEISFLGPAFSITRLLVSIPLVVVTSVLMGNWLEKQGYIMPEGETE